MVAVESAIDAGTASDYSTACTTGTDAYGAADDQKKSGTTSVCLDEPAAWCACVALNATSNTYCVDNTGAKEDTATACAAECTGATPSCQ